MKKVAIIVLILGAFSLNSFANEIELNSVEIQKLLENISKDSKTTNEVKADMKHILNGGTEGETTRVAVINQKCKVVGRSMLVLCKTQIGVESDTEDGDSGFDSVYELETVHMLRSMSLVRVSMIPIAG